MLRKQIAAVLAVGVMIVVPQWAFALGLGQLKATSALNEPFEARIDILEGSRDDFDSLTVGLADSGQFERAGVIRSAVLQNLTFEVIEGRGGAAFILVTSREPVREPFLNFLMEMNWANGRVVREYTVLLDPPLYDPNRRARARRAAPVATPAPAPPPPAARKAPTMTAPTMTAPPAPSIGPYTAGGSRSVNANDTLWSLASSMRPDASVSVQQVMIALLRANPDAFINDNINLLRKGAVLQLPGLDEMTALSRQQAIAEVQRQHQLWEDYRGVAAASVPSQPMGAPATGGGSAGTTDGASGDARLELVAPDDSDARMAGGGASGSGGAALVREELDARIQENAELRAKLGEADEIIDLLQRQVDIKDEELAALQTRLAELRNEIGAEIEAPPEMTAPMPEAEAPAEPEAMPDAEAIAEPEAMPEPEAEAPAPEAVTEAEAVQTPPVEPEAPPAEPESTGSAPEPAPAAGGSFLDQLLPKSLTSLVPGGLVTILGIVAAVLIGVFAFIIRSLMGGKEEEFTSPVAEAAADETVTAMTELADDEAEPITEQRGAGADDEVTLAPDDDGREFESTLEATTDELAGPEAPEEDPLEEVNVYLAYERFDQAEELVRKVIATHPDDHKYKLRLLEVFYSSNNKAAYETEAKALLDAVGDSDPLWDSAVAMWNEMSPDRALFEEGGEPDTDEPAGTTREFVDLTADNADEAGAATMAMAPGGDEVLESTQVGTAADLEATNESTAADDDALDFDLASEGDEDDILDLTATADGGGPAGAADEDDIIDLTSSRDGDGDDDILDLTSTAGAGTAEEVDHDAADAFSGADTDTTAEADDDDVLDLTSGATAGGDAAAGDEDVLDISGGAAPDEDVLDISKTGDEHDLLDVTRGGEMNVDEQHGDILNVTSPGLTAGQQPTPGEADVMDLDLSDSIGPGGPTGEDADDVVLEAPDAGDDSDGSDDAVFDLTSPAAQDVDSGDGEGDDAGDALDFDISGLDVEEETDSPGAEGIADTIEIEATPVADEGDSDEELTIEMGPVETGDDGAADEDDDLTFDLSDTGEMENFDDLSLQSPDLDSAGDDGEETSESDIEFDLALQDTTDMENLSIDETLELPKGTGVTADDNSDGESLEELTRSMEDSFADLELDSDEPDMDMPLEIDDGELELDLDEPDEVEDMLDTVELESDEPGGAQESTVVMPRPEGVDSQSDADEVDTKLNLAKAYIELGDADGARSILDEVARDGDDNQQREAQKLLDQLSK